MSKMPENRTENPDGDQLSVRSNGKSPINGAAVKERMSEIRRSFRKTIRGVAEKSPLSVGAKGSKVTSEAAANETAMAPPPSPSLSSGSPASSPLKSIGSLFQKKEEDEADAAPPKSKGLERSKTDPNMANAFLRRGESLRRSLTFRKKDKDKSSKKEAEEVKEEEEEEEKEEEEVQEEMEEAYTLPEIPHTPLSVMQINNLIQNEVLEEAHLNLLALRREFQQEQERCAEDSSIDLAKKEKDLNLLYGDLRNKVKTIVRDSNSFPARNKALLVPVARVIQEEERRTKEPGGLPDSWMEAWREAVGEGVQVKVDAVHLEQTEQNASWLAVHLGLLGKAILEDLERVKRELRWSYPPSFKVFSTYVRSYHKVVGQHLEKLEQRVTEAKDLYALLNWIINTFKSERIMGSASLQPDMKDERKNLQLEGNLLTKLKDKYCCRMKEDMKFSLDKVTEIEAEDVWSKKKTPEKEDNFLNSEIHMDLWTKVKGPIVSSRQIELEQRVTASCLEELKQFPKRFEAEFRRHCSALRPQPLWTEYQITYINCFSSLQQHMEDYRDSCPTEVEGFRKEVKWLTVRLMQELEDQFKEDVKPYLRRMLTRKWLTNDEDFKQLEDRTGLLCQHCSLIKPPQAQELASGLHHHVVKEYVSQLMKNNYSCKNRKHEKAAAKMRHQLGELRDLFEDMKSTHEWLYPVGDQLSDILAQKNSSDIKEHLQPLVQHYPDFRKDHLVAVLYFRGLMRGREHRLILRTLAELKKKQGGDVGDKSRVLFCDMQASPNTDCLSSLPFSCLSFLLPDN